MAGDSLLTFGADQARLFPRDAGSDEFEASVVGLSGTIDLNTGDVSVGALRVGLDFGDVMSLSANFVTFDFNLDPDTPAQPDPIATMRDVTVVFPAYPNFPIGTIDFVEIGRNEIRVEGLHIGAADGPGGSPDIADVAEEVGELLLQAAAAPGDLFVDIVPEAAKPLLQPADKYDIDVLTQVGDSNTTDLDDSPSINNVGRVSFTAKRTQGGAVFLTNLDREPKQIASSSGGDASRQFRPAAINDAAVFTRILGISDDGLLDAGENLIGGDDLGGLGAFVADSRIGVARIGDGDVYRLVFLADDDLGRRGLYSMQIDLSPGRNGPFKSSAPSRMLAVGDTAWWSAALTSKARPTAKSLMEIGASETCRRSVTISPSAPRCVAPRRPGTR